MIGKVVLFAFLAFVAVQALPKNDISTYDLVSDIKRVIQEITNTLNDLQQNIVNALKDFIDQIKSAMDKTDVKQLIEDIKNAIKTTVGDGEKVIECIAKEEPVIEKIAQQEVDGVIKCSNDALAQVQPLMDRAMVLVKEATDAISSATTGLTNCLNHPVNIVQCLKDLETSLITEAGKLTEEVDALAQDVQMNLPQVAMEQQICLSTVGGIMQGGVMGAIDDVKKCAGITY